MEDKTATMEISEGIAILFLDKPPVNAFDLRLVGDAEECLKAVERDPTPAERGDSRPDAGSPENRKRSSARYVGH